jgi:hypothetical protein
VWLLFVGERIDLSGGMRAVVTNVVGMCSMDVLLVVRDVEKRRRRRGAVGRQELHQQERKEDSASCVGRCMSQYLTGKSGCSSSRPDGISIKHFGEYPFQ